MRAELGNQPSQAQVAKVTAAEAAADRLATSAGYALSEARQCMDCNQCGWDACMPHCPVEWKDEDQRVATIKKYVPRLAPDGQSWQNELRDIQCTRIELMEHLRESFRVADPHLFCDEHQTHARHLYYATMTVCDLGISTDFSAQYSHKAAWTTTCEHPPCSNMDVFVCTRVEFVDDVRIYITDVWRIISAAKGSAGFHNKALSQITEYYRHVMELKCVWAFTDGCKGQYKGRRNFRRISTFPFEHSKESFQLQACMSTSKPPSADELAAVLSKAATSGAAAAATPASWAAVNRAPACAMQPPPAAGARVFVQWGTFPLHDVKLRHNFACSNHFKGTHDAYGKDGKHLPRTAERQQKVRIADAFDLYDFDATHLPCPRRNVLAADIVAALRRPPPTALERKPLASLPADWRATLQPQIREVDEVEELIASRTNNSRDLERARSAAAAVAADATADINSYNRNMEAGAASAMYDADECAPCDAERIVDGYTAGNVRDASTGVIEDGSAGAEQDGDCVEPDDPHGRIVDMADAEAESEPEEDAGDFDFEFDETGARITREEQQDDAGVIPSPKVASSVGSSKENDECARPQKATRRPRIVRVTIKAAGCECQPMPTPANLC